MVEIKDVLNLMEKLKMPKMAERYSEHLIAPDILNLPIMDILHSILDSEWSHRYSTKRLNLIKQGHFPEPSASIDKILYFPDRGLERELIINISSCEYLNYHKNIIILGSPGFGKTYLSNVFGLEACDRLIPVKYYRLPDLLFSINKTRDIENAYIKFIRKLSKIKLLIIDEWLLYDINEQNQRDLLEIMEVREKNASTILCSQIEVDDWSKKLGDTPLSKSIVDRIRYKSINISIKGNFSMRKRLEEPIKTK
jgi:DNA replication protein DnaC